MTCPKTGGIILLTSLLANASNDNDGNDDIWFNETSVIFLSSIEGVVILNLFSLTK